MDSNDNKITQERNKFVGIKLIGNQWVGKGEETIKGELEGDGFKSLDVVVLDENRGICAFDTSLIRIVPRAINDIHRRKFFPFIPNQSCIILSRDNQD